MRLVRGDHVKGLNPEVPRLEMRLSWSAASFSVEVELPFLGGVHIDEEVWLDADGVIAIRFAGGEPISIAVSVLPAGIWEEAYWDVVTRALSGWTEDYGRFLANVFRTLAQEEPSARRREDCVLVFTSWLQVYDLADRIICARPDGEGVAVRYDVWIAWAKTQGQAAARVEAIFELLRQRGAPPLPRRRQR